MDVPYSRQTIDHPNPIARFAHRSRYANALRLALDHAPERGGSVLDFGAGDGEFLDKLRAERSDLVLTAFEPYMNVRFPGIHRVREAAAVADDSIDLLCCFETLEHLSEEHIVRFIHTAHRVCRKDAKIVISVPVMNGVALPVKEASRVFLFRRFSDYTLTELLKGTMGAPVPRAADILKSHKGFDHRVIMDRLERHFQSVEAFSSPLRSLPWWLNSQAFAVFKAR